MLHSEMGSKLERMLPSLVARSLLTCSIRTINEDGDTKRVYVVSYYYKRESNMMGRGKKLQGQVKNTINITLSRKSIESEPSTKQENRSSNSRNSRKKRGRRRN
ncbi:hypothetical protein AAHE18_17G143800 [Arachis hypogaea]